ncbi:HalOD1 output domain-containing protein [Natrialbaceae archaeon A-CW2]|uniref:HalOD1 output domain-containing protein n=1 Tax=Natronosalvus amylolyticus TaxID=2961994 RepID=UPI0020C9CC0C|nr:HalOD1 output domain-containing protein [Natronosalvus amylolyticus]
MGRHEQMNATSRKSTSLTIVSEVAKREGVPEKELQPPLFEVIDPDALDALFTNESSTENMVSVSFDYAGYRITVDSDQTVTVK